jgi:hypothetical protein
VVVENKTCDRRSRVVYCLRVGLGARAAIAITGMIIMFFRSFSRKHGPISNGALSNTNLRGIRHVTVSNTLPTNFHAFIIFFLVSKFGRRKHPIVTLDPNKFAEKQQQCLHIGNITTLRPWISLPKQSRRLLVSLNYDKSDDNRIPYPRDTKAFLYYSMSPEKPRIAAGELRLRVTSSDGPASFESGSDLLRTDGLPWSRPLYILSKHHPPLYEKLREEGFIPDDLDRVLAALPKRRIKYSRSQVLYTLNDTFIIDSLNPTVMLLVITEQGVESLRVQRMFLDRRPMDYGAPSTGADTSHHLSILLY